MPSPSQLLAFTLTAFVIIVIPGPSVTFIVARALAHGRRAAVLTVIGNTMGEYVQVVAVAFGAGVLVERSVAAFTLLKLFGAAYLIYLGLRAIRDRGSLGAFLDPERPHSAARYLVQGSAVGVANPKTVIFLAAILPEFVNRTAGRIPEQVLFLGLLFSAIALVSDTAWALAAGAARAWFARSPRRLRLIGGVSGLAIVAQGVRLALTGRRD
jgi:threonine/homoserine/homoserine lactone efflux protein